MTMSEAVSCLGCFPKPFRKTATQRTTSSSFPTLKSAGSTLVESELVGDKSDSEIRAHLLLRLVGGECYGAVSTSTTEMDTTLWSTLLEELLPRVLLFLPFISKLRFRAVCKEWRRLLSSSDYIKENTSAILHPPRAPLVCAYRFIHGNRLKERGCNYVRNSSASLESRQLSRKLKCRELPLLFPDIDPPDSRGGHSHNHGQNGSCRIDANVSAEDGVLTIEVWKERQLLHGNLRRHRGVPTVLDLFTFFINPITDTVLSLPEMRTEGDHSLGRNLGVVSSKVVPHLNHGGHSFDTSTFYWTSWWLDVGIGLRQNTSWFTRVRKHPVEAGRYPETVNVMDRSALFNVIGVGITELEGGKFQSVISDGVVYGVHYLPDGRNRLFTRTLHYSQTKQWSQWHNDASVPKVNDAIDVHFLLVDHRLSQSVFYVGQACHRSGRVMFRICRLQPDCYPRWFWLPISVMPSALVDEMMSRLGTSRAGLESSAVLDRAFAVGDFIVLVFRNSAGAQQGRVCFVAFDVYEETWEIVFAEEDCEELAEFDGFFEVRPDLRFPHEIRDGMKLY
ncbi:unnamed protein product [Calypogeia fissa]